MTTRQKVRLEIDAGDAGSGHYSVSVLVLPADDPFNPVEIWLIEQLDGLAQEVRTGQILTSPQKTLEGRLQDLLIALRRRYRVVEVDGPEIVPVGDSGRAVEAPSTSEGFTTPATLEDLSVASYGAAGGTFDDRGFHATLP